jgi:hypothetical protein
LIESAGVRFLLSCQSLGGGLSVLRINPLAIDANDQRTHNGCTLGRLDAKAYIAARQNRWRLEWSNSGSLSVPKRGSSDERAERERG